MHHSKAALHALRHKTPAHIDPSVSLSCLAVYPKDYTPLISLLITEAALDGPQKARQANQAAGRRLFCLQWLRCLIDPWVAHTPWKCKHQQAGARCKAAAYLLVATKDQN